MSMSTYVRGFRPPDERWQQMRAVWDACKEAGVDLPLEVNRFFDGEQPDKQGVEVDLGDAVTEWENDTRAGFEVDVSKLPPDLRVIRFWNSW